ncbi:type 1 glutamine amidotransferase [Embleya sp. NBC_00896]|uniref:type 1 glutamine amidotransferase n=1 Tax=Embleya sp. NBC_00896 TaxID=2975961 RepID=UPI00386C93A7|nr:type 1 glutamine amidotransferase [Embleya sp. NBC_00896]
MNDARQHTAPGTPATRGGEPPRTANVLVVEHEDGTGPGLFGERIAAHGFRLDLRRPWKGDELPDDLTGFDALLVLGGTPGPYDDATSPWLPHTRTLLRQATAADLPTFGICLGAELLTVACGGSVRHAEHPEVGPVTVTTTAAAGTDRLFAPLTVDAEHGTPAVQWHWEETESLPPGAVVLAGSEHCAVQAYRLGEHVWAVQFHPEVLTDAAREWASHDEGQLPPLGIDPAVLVAEVAAIEPRLRADWGALADRWAAVVTDRLAGAGTGD